MLESKVLSWHDGAIAVVHFYHKDIGAGRIISKNLESHIRMQFIYKPGDLRFTMVDVPFDFSSPHTEQCARAIHKVKALLTDRLIAAMK